MYVCRSPQGNGGGQAKTVSDTVCSGTTWYLSGPTLRQSLTSDHGVDLQASGSCQKRVFLMPYIPAGNRQSRWQAWPGAAGRVYREQHHLMVSTLFLSQPEQRNPVQMEQSGLQLLKIWGECAWPTVCSPAFGLPGWPQLDAECGRKC